MATINDLVDEMHDRNFIFEKFEVMNCINLRLVTALL